MSSPRFSTISTVTDAAPATDPRTTCVHACTVAASPTSRSASVAIVRYRWHSTPLSHTARAAAAISGQPSTALRSHMCTATATESRRSCGSSGPPFIDVAGGGSGDRTGICDARVSDSRRV